MRTHATILCLVIASALLPGCSTTKPSNTAGQGQAIIAFAPSRYAEVHADAVEVLRDHGFRIARNDYRFGTITTYPKESPTLVEFWIDDATTRDQNLSDTLNAQQRTVTIKIAKTPEIDLEAAIAGQSPETQQPVALAYTLTVQVLVERLQLPDRYLTRSVTGEPSATYAATPTHLRDRSIDGPYAQVLTRDPLLERRLLEAIRDAVNAS